MNLGIVCGCIPSLKPLVARILPRLIRNKGESSRETSDQGQSTNSNTGSPPVSRDTSHTGSATRSKDSQSANIYTISSDEPIGMLDFLTTSGTTSQAQESGIANTRRAAENIPFFDFVTVKHPKSMLKMSNQESLAPVALISILFFLLGFAYGFIDVLNAQFRQIAGYDIVKSFELHAAYYGGYVVGPILVGRPVLKRSGFKATLITGLSIYACGTLIFWPSAVLISLPAFVISNFIVGSGFAVLETAANSFISLCGPMENAEVRLSFSQGVRAVGGVVSPILAQKVLFQSVNDVPSLINVQWTYLGIALFTILVAVAYHYLPVPEASDEDLKELAERRRKDNSARVCGVPVVQLTLSLGFFSQFCYIGGQECLQTKFQTFVTYNEPK